MGWMSSWSAWAVHEVGHLLGRHNTAQQRPPRHHAVSIQSLLNWKSGMREVAEEGVTEEDAYHPVKMILHPCFHPLLRYWTTAPQYPKTLALHQSSLRLDAVRPSTTVVACSSILSVIGGYNSVSSLAGTPCIGREHCVDCGGPFPGLDDPLSGPSAAWSDTVAAVSRQRLCRVTARISSTSGLRPQITRIISVSSCNGW